jgi:HSP20 family protein
MQRDLQTALDTTPTIRGTARGGFPAMNVGGTPEAVEIFAFVPGVDPANLDVTLEKGVMTLSGERAARTPDDPSTCHLDERFAGRFRRVVNLPDDIDSETASADYRDGVLHIRIARRVAAQPRRIAVH